MKKLFINNYVLYRKINDGQWGWRALRLLAKKSPHFFTYGNNPIGKLNEYLETMLRKMSPALQQSLSSQPIGNEGRDVDFISDSPRINHVRIISKST